MRNWVLGAALSIAVLAGCGAEPNSEAPEAAPTASDPRKNTTAAEAAAMFPQEELPNGAPKAPVTGGCVIEFCEVDKASFSRRDWPKAWQGDYAAQRNVAYCRATGCNGAVETNGAEACAWRSIIIVAHVGSTIDSDTANLKSDCDQLDDAGMAVAITTAENIYSRIYDKPMPKAARSSQ